MPEFETRPPASILSDLLRVAPKATVAWIANEETRTFAEASERCANVANWLGAWAPVDGVIAILGENSGTYIECLYAIPDAQCRALLLNYRHHPREWVAMLQRTQAVAVVGDLELLEQLAPFLAAARLTVQLIAFDPGRPNEATPSDAAAPDCAYASYEQIATSSSQPGRTLASDPDACAWLVPTSGTTGTPKLAMLSHNSLLTAAWGCHLARPVAADDVYLYPFPLCHVAAYNVLVYHQHARPIVVMRRFDAPAIIALIAKHQCTATSLAPTMLSLLLDAHAFEQGENLSSLRSIGYGSSAIPAPLLRRAIGDLGCDFSQGYGMTELSGNAVFLDATDHSSGVDHNPELLTKAGRATPLVELRIVDDDGQPVSDGVVGEITVRGAQIMIGYFNDPTATSEALRNNWLFTGDLGVLTDGYLRVVDRKKDVIITGGENVASREVEAVLYQHPSVAEVAVVGLSDERWGEIVAAAIVLRPGLAVSEEALTTHCRQSLAGFKIPRRMAFVAELPKNTTGKIEKPRVREYFATTETTHSA